METVFSLGSNPMLYNEDPRPVEIEIEVDPVWRRGRIPPS
jgi:hypothetical protein